MTPASTASPSRSRLGALGRRLGPDGAASLALFALFAVVYCGSIDLFSPNLLSHNFVFDADIDRIVADAAGRQNGAVFGRHPLFVLVLAAPASALSRLGFAPAASLRTIVAMASAAGVALSRSVFHRVIGDRWLALAFALLYGSASTVWLLSSVPETFALNACVIAVCFAFVTSERTKTPDAARGGSWASLAMFSAFSALAVGITVSNAAYVGLAFAMHVMRSPSHVRVVRRLSLLAFHAASVGALFVVLSLLQKGIFPGHVGHESGVVNPLAAASEDVFLSFGRGFSLKDALMLLRAFLVDNLVAPGCVVDVVNTPSGPNQMLQFGDWTRPSYVLGVVLLGSVVLVAVRGASVQRALTSAPARLGLAYLAFNLGLHYFYRANGQPFIFSVHTVLPVLVILAALSAKNDSRTLRALLVALTTAIVQNSLVFIASVRDALALPCETKEDSVCVAWKKPADPRFARGLATYLASGWHSAELGRAALERGRPREAIRFYREALARDRQLGWAERDLGFTLLETGERDEARVHLGHVVERDPGDLLARQMLESLGR